MISVSVFLRLSVCQHTRTIFPRFLVRVTSGHMLQFYGCYHICSGRHNSMLIPLQRVMSLRRRARTVTPLLRRIGYRLVEIVVQWVPGAEPATHHRLVLLARNKVFR